MLAAPTPEDAELITAFQLATNQILLSRGADQTWARQVHAAMRDEGLTDIDTEVHARSWPGGTPGALLLRVTLDQLYDEFLASGLTRSQLEQVRRLAGDPALVWRGLITYSTIGRRSAGGAS